MLLHICNATLRILFFRDGPQDFPYVPARNRSIILGAIAVNAAILSVALPVAVGLIVAAAVVGGIALVTQSVLRLRELPNRFDQTLHALLATTTLLNVLMLPALLQLAPVVMAVAENPALLEHPDAIKIPPAAGFIIDVTNFWKFAVSAHIFRHAADARLWVGALIALTVAFTILSLVVFVGAALQALLGQP
jgi:hypothetical protein